MRIPESELIINADGSAFHIHMRPEDLADIVIVFGDPGRVKMFESLFEKIEVKGQSREFAFATGIYNGKRVTALSHGIGCDNIDIVMTELDALANIDFKTREVKPEHKTLTIVRIGTCGAIQPEIPLGSFILSHISVGCDGLMNWYEGRDKIALLDFEEEFKKAVKWDRHLPDPYFVRASERLIDLFKDCTVKGMTVSASGFYGPQGRVVRQGLAMPDMLEDFEKFEYKGYKITNFEMEGSALAGMAAKLGHDAITVCCAIAHRYLKDANTDY
ncbi:MAG: nucleoside phosphorylase, partial [Bacteroidales bacterium]|nr:nucleoside phosphorylase [Bacteroidales bacterium]